MYRLSWGLYALSFDGRLLEFSGGRYQVFPLKGKNYMQMVALDGKLILLSATEGLVIARVLSSERTVCHRSAVTSILLHENKLYSCSYDRTLRLWNLSPDSMAGRLY